MKLWVFIAAAFVIFSMVAVYPFCNVETTTVTVKEKAIKRYNEHDNYLVFTDKEVYVVKDCLMRGQFASSDIYGSMQLGKSYNIKSFGYRVPILSMYKVIYEVSANG